MWVTGSQKKDHPWVNLAFNYLGWSDLYDGDKLDWTKVEESWMGKGNGCQAIIRIRAVPDDSGDKVEVPDFVKQSSDYTDGNAPDWSSKAMQDMVRDTHKAFIQKYNDDTRLYLYQVGFGYWGECHLAGGPIEFKKGRTFPTDEYVKSLFEMLDQESTKLKWAVSIDFADTLPDLIEWMNSKFICGVFNDTILQPGAYKSENLKKLRSLKAEERGETQINGGEFGNDAPPLGDKQINELDEYNQEFKTSYIVFNMQFSKSSKEAVEEVSIDMGYQLEIRNVKERQLTISNIGVASVYFDIFLNIDGEKCSNVNLNLLKENTSIDVKFDKKLTSSTNISF